MKKTYARKGKNMNHRTTIIEAERRLDLAREIQAEYLGYSSRNPEGLTVRKFGGYVVIEDGETTWLASLEDHDNAVERLLADILDGEVLSLPSPFDEGAWSEFRGILYERFWDNSACIFRQDGAYGDLSTLAALPDEVKSDIVEQLGVEDEFGDYTEERAEKQRKEHHAERVELAKSKLGDLTGYTADFRGTGKLIAPDTEDGRILASEALAGHLGGFGAEAAESDGWRYHIEDLKADQVEHLIDFGWCLADTHGRSLK